MKRTRWLILSYVLVVQFVGAVAGGFLAQAVGPDEARRIVVQAIERTLGNAEIN